MSQTLTINFELNGTPTTTTVPAGTVLRDLLRQLGMMSVKFGSSSGETGAAAVLIDGQLASTDVLLAAQIDGHSVTTVEALNTERELHPIQTAFTVTGAFQSGYSAGAMVLGTMALLEANPDPSEDEIRDMLSGILDRETAYVKPVEAVFKRAARRAAGRDPPIAFAPVDPCRR